MTRRDGIAIALLLLCALTMLFLLRLYRKRTSVEAEWVRKLAHIGTGFMAICLPWIFSTRVPVFVVCGGSIALLLAIRYLPSYSMALTANRGERFVSPFRSRSSINLPTGASCSTRFRLWSLPWQTALPH